MSVNKVVELVEECGNKFGFNVEEALLRIYDVKNYNSARSACMINLPICFIGKKLKLVIVE
jgi:hypothetical protein